MFTHDDSTASSDTRTRVLAAARTVLAERGIAKVRIEAVARAAGLSAGALYRHFKGRQELIFAVILDSLPAVSAIADAPIPQGSGGRAALRELIDEVYQHEVRMASVVVTVLADEALHTQFQQALSGAPGGPRNFTLLLQRTLERFRSAGHLRADADPATAAATVQARCFHHAMLHRLIGSTSDSADEPDPVAELVETLTAELAA